MPLYEKRRKVITNFYLQKRICSDWRYIIIIKYDIYLI